MARLKVFRAEMGFFDTIVAAASQKAALAAWGTRQDLFGEGHAELTTDVAAVRAALARPGLVLRRPIGGKGPYQPEDEAPASLPKPPAAPKRKAGAKPSPSKSLPSKPKPKPPPADRTVLTQAEAALADRETRFQSNLDAIASRRRELDEREADLTKAMERDRGAIERALAKARAAFIKAGGEP